MDAILKLRIGEIFVSAVLEPGTASSVGQRLTCRAVWAPGKETMGLVLNKNNFSQLKHEILKYVYSKWLVQKKLFWIAREYVY